MRIDCITINNGHIRFKKNKLTVTPYVQDLIKSRMFIFTDDSVGYLNSLKQTYDIDVDHEIKVEYRWETENQRERLNKINSVESLDFQDVVNNLEEYSVFVYYGYISNKTKSNLLKSWIEEYKVISNDILNKEIINIVKEIRKEYFCSTISYRGKDIKPDDKMLSSLSFLMVSPDDDEIDYRFEDGSFAKLTKDQVKEIYSLVYNHTQKIMNAEQYVINHLQSLPLDMKEQIAVNEPYTIKNMFDNQVRG